MDATLQALGGILLRAAPTLLLVLLLHFYLKLMFFKPLEAVLQRRYEATEGARKLAEQSLERASAKSAEYEAAIRAARAELYQAQDKLHKSLQDEQAAQVSEARSRADELVRQAREQMARDVASARSSLAGESEGLARRIADTILRRSAA